MIGIVGGLGPYGGLDIAKKIIDETAARSDQEHLPLLLFSCPNVIPDRTAYLLDKSNDNPGKAIAGILRKLEVAGATIAAIPSNTAHAEPIFSVVQDEMARTGSAMKLLNIVHETVRFVDGNYPETTIGILSTAGEQICSLYREAFIRKGFIVVEPEGPQQEKVNNAIYDEDYGIKAQPIPIANKAREDLLLVVDDLKKKGAQVIILGCAELPLAIPERDYNGMIIIDPNRILARALVHEAAPDKLKPL
ncbi:MAG: amino acid racemase [Sphingobacterium sp.]|jgi:aspartate racemase|uniref:aspartate/glutamate racemase family protein n=1 Tax=Sphingobacterium sp. TaxID=341027 RepID=UPI002821CD69|nr:amino acid racemase [Sphingobacterium sp.]MDR0265252.1 amino acid racemase [Sphingobacterium sp.]